MRVGWLGKPRRFYRGFPVVRMKRRRAGTIPVCHVTCRECGTGILRDARSIKSAEKTGRGFVCDGCWNSWKRSEGKVA